MISGRILCPDRDATLKLIIEVKRQLWGLPDRYVGEYEWGTIELVRNNWNKTLKLLINSEEVASESRVLPHHIELTASFDGNGGKHTAVAKSDVHFLSSKESVEVDGKPLTLTKIK